MLLQRNSKSQRCILCTYLHACIPIRQLGVLSYGKILSSVIQRDVDAMKHFFFSQNIFVRIRQENHLLHDPHSKLHTFILEGGRSMIQKSRHPYYLKINWTVCMLPPQKISSGLAGERRDSGSGSSSRSGGSGNRNSCCAIESIG